MVYIMPLIINALGGRHTQRGGLTQVEIRSSVEFTLKYKHYKPDLDEPDSCQNLKVHTL